MEIKFYSLSEVPLQEHSRRDLFVPQMQATSDVPVSELFEKCTLADTEPTFPKSRGWKWIATHSAHIFRGFRLAGRAVDGKTNLETSAHLERSEWNGMCDFVFIAWVPHAVGECLLKYLKKKPIQELHHGPVLCPIWNKVAFD